MPFDQYQRYSDIKRILAAIDQGVEGSLKTCLDVGGFHADGQGRGWLPAKELLSSYKVTALDRIPTFLPGYVQGDGTQLPFKDKAFDVVFCCDTLEHVDPDKRELLVENLIRTARSFVIIGGPFFSEQVARAERILADFIQAALGVRHKQLQEHIELGLPRVSELTALLDRRGLDHMKYESGSLFTWLPMMMMKHSLLAIRDLDQHHLILDTLFNICFEKGEHDPPGYRTVFVIAVEQGCQPLLEALEKEFRRSPRASRYDESMAWVLAQLNITMNTVLHERWQAIGERSVELERIVKQQAEVIVALQGALDKAEGSLRSRLKRYLIRRIDGLVGHAKKNPRYFSPSDKV